MGATFPEVIAENAGQLACLPDRNAPKQPSNGLQVTQRYKVSGARGEAQAGFPSVIVAGLPRLHRSRRLCGREAVARLDALLAIMASLEDTCLLHRGGLAALNTAQAGAASILDAGGTATPEGWKRLQQLHHDLLALNASPGGSADLLAATLFLDFVSTP
jgi:triphosphoribosyl-dephospho-CoA synthase